MISRFNWWPAWLEKKHKYVLNINEPQLDEDTFYAICVGNGLPDIHQRATFAFDNVADGASKFMGKADNNEKPYTKIYTRLGNPNTAHLENILYQLECNHVAEKATQANETQPVIGCLVSASGMGSISAVLTALVKPGDKILAGNIYSGSDSYLRYMEKFNVKRVFCDTTNLQEIEKAFELNPEIVGVLIESPVNPTIELTDINAISKITEKYGALLMVDNTFCSPYLQQPFRLGADVVFHSLTKYVNGHSASIAGAALGPFEFFKNQVYRVYKDFGATPSPFDSWLNSLTIQDLGLRVKYQSETALKLAEFLNNNPLVESVSYPGLKNHPQFKLMQKQMRLPGAMMSFKVKGGYDAAVKLMNYFGQHDTPMELAVSLGGLISYIQHPASMTHSNMQEAERLKSGISNDLIRFSVGAEGFTTLKNALDQGLKLTTL